MKRHGPRAALIATLAMFAAAGCRGGTPDDEAIRALVAAQIAAIEQGDIAGFMEHVCDSYTDEAGRAPDELRALLFGYLQRYGRPTVQSRVRDVEVVATDDAPASATVEVAALARSAAGAEGDVYVVTLGLVKPRGWCVRSAGWQSGSLTDLVAP